MHPRETMGFETPDDKRIPVSVREWNAAKRAIWRSRESWRRAMTESARILAGCRHEKDCPGEDSETEPCFAGCPDREIRMSALVIMNAGRTLSPVIAPRPTDHYFAPSREYFSEVLSALASAEAECAALRAVLRERGIEEPPVPTNAQPAQFEDGSEKVLKNYLEAHPDDEEIEEIPDEEDHP